MADAPSTSSRSVFISDLRRIRESRALTLEGLHESTKIPLSVLEDFEETGLFDNPMFNRVYLRSLVRTYASYVGIPTKTMLEALDEALLDSYKGDLARLYLEEESEESTEAPPVEVVTPSSPPVTDTTSPPEDRTPEGTSAEEGVPEAPAPEESVAEDTSPKAPPAAEPAVEDTAAEDVAAEVAPTEEVTAEDVAPGDGAVDEVPAEETAVEEEPVLKEDTVVHEIQQMLRVGEKARTDASVASATPETAPSRGRRRPPMLTTAEAMRQSPGGSRVRSLDVKRRAWYTQWMIIVVAVVGFAVAIWAVLVVLQRPDATNQAQRVAVDSTTVDSAAVLSAEPLRPQLTLDDTLYVVLLAVEKVERIQIRRDDDLLRAYWIEEGVAKAFPALDRIVFENRLDLIRLFVEGFEYPTDIRDEEDRVVITRADLRAMADTLTASPMSLPAPPDTIPLWPVRGQ